MLKIVLISVCLVLPVSACFAAGKAEVELYVMSQCPYGTEAEDALFPVLKEHSAQVELKVGFIGNSTEGPGGKAKFDSLHGQPEVEENIRQLCARDLTPDKWLDYVLERNKNIKDARWEAAAAFAGINPKLISDCAAGPGIKSYTDNLALARTRKANSSPTIYIGGESYTGPRTREGFEWSVCSALRAKGAKLPAACAKLLAGPKPAGGPGGGGDCGGPAAPFNIRVVAEKNCKVCAPPMLEEVKQNHPSARLLLVDSESPEGKALITAHKARVLPFFVLDKAVEKEANYKGKLENFYLASSGAYLFKPGPTTFSPSVQLGRALTPGHLDIFVEALSPDSMQVASDLMAILTADPEKTKDLTLSWHLATQEAPAAENTEAAAAPAGSKKMALSGGNKTRLVSSRGEAEVAESLRQACLFQYESFSVFMTYLNCRYYNLADMSRPWQCYKPEGKVKECIDGGEGERLLRADARLASGLEARAPAMLWENRYGPFVWGSVDLNELIGWKH